MIKLAIEVCFENHFGLIHAIFLSLGSTKSGYFFLGHPVYEDRLEQLAICPYIYAGLLDGVLNHFAER